MDATAIALAIAALQALPTLMAVSVEVAGFISSTVTSLQAMQAEGRDPTQAEWDALNTQISVLRSQLDS